MTSTTNKVSQDQESYSFYKMTRDGLNETDSSGVNKGGQVQTVTNLLNPSSKSTVKFYMSPNNKSKISFGGES